ncbi:hypothetical protein FKP32DRAFT_1754533 [Trametes sanguinea]|nr:hypothetical protein FKP32DRAFT_1754533 [Trametes sanguinea]
MSELSTSRIARQLRTLRAKCAGLNSLQTRALAPSKPAVSVTYGHSKNSVKRIQDDEETPPLAILQSLDNFGARLHLDRAIVENMQLSKRIYEVRDAFRNIVQSALGTPKDIDVEATRRVLPLTAICARLIGEHVQSEVQAAVDDAAEDGREDEVASQVLDELFEQVPPSYRHRMLIAHALTYILDECPHHPTLLHALLEVCLSHELLPEARTILFALFTVAVQPRPHSAYTCPLTHPAHKNFLSTLKETCSTSGVNDRTFTHTLLDALCERAGTRLHAWTSKAVTKLARDLRERDFSGSFVPLCSGLVVTIAEERRKGKPASRTGKQSDDEHAKFYSDGLERLAKWVISMLDRLQASPQLPGEDFRNCVDFLALAAVHRLHVSDDTPSSPQTCLADSLACLAAYCLSYTHATSLHTSELSALRELLQSAHIKNTTFDGLVSHIFPLPRFTMFAMPLAEPGGADSPTPPPTPPTAHLDSLAELSALAGPLHTHGLQKCEAALWLAALQHVEELISSPTVTQSMTTPGRKLNQSELFNLRLALIDRVEEAERRCYGGGTVGAMAGAMPPSVEGEWEWEEMVGSWVLKSPAPVRAKIARDNYQAKTQRRTDSLPRASSSHSGPTRNLRETLAAARASRSAPAASESISAQGRPSQSSSAPVYRSALSRGSAAGIVAKKKRVSFAIASSPPPSRSASSRNQSDDEENTAPAHVSQSQKTGSASARRVSSFETILADARTNVISLRAEREAKAKARAMAAKRQSSVSAHTTPISVPPAQMHTPRRQSNFATLIADAQRNAISLREERARKEQATLRYKRRSSEDTMSDWEEDPRPVQVHKKIRQTYAPEPESSPMRGGGLVHPSSDDALNLFAYSDSSPVKR